MRGIAATAGFGLVAVAVLVAMVGWALGPGTWGRALVGLGLVLALAGAVAAVATRRPPRR